MNWLYASISDSRFGGIIKIVDCSKLCLDKVGAISILMAFGKIPIH